MFRLNAFVTVCFCVLRVSFRLDFTRWSFRAVTLTISGVSGERHFEHFPTSLKIFPAESFGGTVHGEPVTFGITAFATLGTVWATSFTEESFSRVLRIFLGQMDDTFALRARVVGKILKRLVLHFGEILVIWALTFEGHLV